MRFEPPATWPDLVYHVLAHVEGEFPASVHDRDYLRWAEERLGPAAGRELGADAAVLATLAGDHEAHARVERVAWLHRDLDEAERAGGEAIAELDAAAEVLRCAALLELPAYRSLPPIRAFDDAARAAFERVRAAAPALATMRIMPLRALRLRGRVCGDAIWVGSPGEVGLGAEHAAMQAAHEATVQEIANKLPAGEGTHERAIEARAVELLRERAAAVGLAAAHARWLACL